MPIRVEVDGLGPLEFLDGTDPAVIQSTVKRLVGQKGDAPNVPYTSRDGAVTNDPAVAKRWREEDAAPQPSTFDNFKRGLGLGVRDAIEGVGQLPGLAYDVARLPLNAGISGINALAGTNIPPIRTAQENLSAIGDALGLPQPATAAERVQSEIGKNVASLIPSMGAGAALQGGQGAAQFVGQALMGAPVSQLSGAMGAGALGGVAKEAGYGPVGQTAAALTGGVAGAALPLAGQLAARGIASAVQPFSQSGREKIIGEALLRNSSDPETLALRLRNGADDASRRLPGSPVTAAVAARDPQMLILENGLRSDAQGVAGGMSPAAAMRDVEAQRNATRLATGEALIQNPVSTDLRGNQIREALGFGNEGFGARQGMKARTDQLYDAIPKDARFSLSPLVDSIESAKATVFGPGSGGMPAELKAAADEIGKLARPAVSAPQGVDWQTLQNLRSRLNGIAGQAAATKDAPTASVAGNLVRKIDEIGGGPEWQAATAQRRAMGEALGRDATGANATGRILNRDQFGAPLLPDARVAATATETPGAARQVLGAFDKAVTDAKAAGVPAERIAELQARSGTARQAMRDHFADRMIRQFSTTTQIADAAGNTTTQLSPAKFSNWWRDNKEVADVLFTPEQRRTLDRLAADFAETTVTGTARARGSDTAQNLSVGNFIARLTGGVVDPQNPLAQTVAGLGPVARWIFQAPEQAMREMLVQAIRDPKFAAQLVEKAGPQSMERALSYWQLTMPERVRDAAAGALAREMPRAAIAPPNQDPRQLPGPAAR